MKHAPMLNQDSFKDLFASLQTPKRSIAPIARQQRIVCATLHNASGFQRMDTVRTAHRRQTLGNDGGGAVAATTSKERWMAASVSLSTALVASSSTKIGGFFKMARAKASLCR